MTPLTLQQQLARLRRERAELSARLYVHALADEDAEAVELYEQLQAMDSEIYALEQMRQDALQAGWLERQGAAAVAWVEKMLAVEVWQIERDGRAAVRAAEAILEEARR